MGCANAKELEEVLQRRADRVSQSVDRGIKNAVQTAGNLNRKVQTEMESALARSDHPAINRLLDSAIAGQLISGKHTPEVLRRAAQDAAARQLREAIEAQDTKRLKGALVCAQRLNQTELPEFEAALAKYKELKKLPAGWDLQKMVLSREGDKMIARMQLDEPAVKAKFQQLLDATFRQIYTRDRQGQPVPDGLELVSVSLVANDELWANYMVRRETIRQELEECPGDFVSYEVDTGTSDGTKDITDGLAADFGEQLMPSVNEVFLFHGTSADAASKITQSNYRLNLAGSYAGTLYGRGIYLAENSTKSDEYTRPTPSGERHLLLCRAVLGRVFYLDTKDADPRACEAACLEADYHSVLGDRKKARGTFREFIVFDEDQVYPNYILTYRRKDATVPHPTRTMLVRCPPGAGPGFTIEVHAPDGSILRALVPPGISEGQDFSVQY
eukprot:TRINITY_DN58172_c0_g1_i1.p1 TRINITY_DN58172_c0_g1~~TRINITY_DN58172_c0_g1_i1.p1  ORF type:complete len:454 (+),score=67.27 TRINITY_DN58172_c0_g1_i1:31-1362(+)